jgi:hypothetical protein
MMTTRQYQRVRTVPPDFWTVELRQVFDLWVQDMRCGMRPYTDRTVQTFERRFILYTRRGWEGRADSLDLSEVFKLTNVYSVISQYPVESYSNRHNMLYSLISFAKFLIAMGLLEEEILQRLRKLRPRRVTPARKTVLRQLALHLFSKWATTKVAFFSGNSGIDKSTAIAWRPPLEMAMKKRTSAAVKKCTSF